MTTMSQRATLKRARQRTAAADPDRFVGIGAVVFAVIFVALVLGGVIP